MKVEAIRVENGFLIPSNSLFENIKENKVLMGVEIIEQQILEDGYAVLDEMIGFCESNRTDASIRHDEIIYDIKCD